MKKIPILIEGIPLSYSRAEFVDEIFTEYENLNFLKSMLLLKSLLPVYPAPPTCSSDFSSMEQKTIMNWLKLGKTIPT